MISKSFAGCAVVIWIGAAFQGSAAPSAPVSDGGVAGCDVVCPPGATPENEPECGLDAAGMVDDFTNGGCLPDDPAFTPIACGETICGTAGSSLLARDTDWYRLVLDQDAFVTFRVTAEFVVDLAIADTCGIDDCDAFSGKLEPFVQAAACEDAIIDACLEAGVYYVVVAPGEGQVTCGAEYTLTAECGGSCEIPRGACCLPDNSCLEDLTECRCELAPPFGAGGRWRGPGVACTPDPCTPPANDDCDDAQELPVPGQASGFTIAATADDAPGCGLLEAPSNGVWYVVAGDGTTLTATTCSDDTSFDTVLQVFCDCCDLVCVTHNDDDVECPSTEFQSTVSWCSQEGQPYYIQVGGFGGAAGTFDINVTSDGLPCAEPADCEPPLGRCCYKCPWDVDRDGDVDTEDLVATILGWAPTGCGDDCAADSDRDGDVDGDDLANQLLNWSPFGCDPAPLCAGTTRCECAGLDGEWIPEADCASDPCPVPISSERCDEALEIDGLPFQIAFDNDESSADGPAGSCNDAGAALMQNDVWFTFTADEACLVEAVIDARDYPGILAAWSGPDCTALEEIACITADGVPAPIQFAVSAGSTVWFQLGARGLAESGGLTIFDLDCVAAGACCTDDACTFETPADCAALGGAYQGDGTECQPDPCPEPTGACCNGTDCSITTESDCGAGGGEYLGDGTTCDGNPCLLPSGACCTLTGCAVLTPEACELAGGTYLGDGQPCQPDSCDPTGACCRDGQCTIETQADCTADGGEYQGDDIPCEADTCIEPTGACCQMEDACTITTEADCVDNLGGSYQGDGSNCDDGVKQDMIPDVCEAGSCCFSDHCEVLTKYECESQGATWLGEGQEVSCDDFPEVCQAPSNDTCDTARPIGVGETIIASNTLATNQVTPFCGTGSSFKELWYVVTGDGGTMTATTCHEATSIDTRMQVFCDCETLTCVGGSDDDLTCPETVFFSTVEWCSEAGRDYYIAVGGDVFGDVGIIAVTVTSSGISCSPAACAEGLAPAGGPDLDGNGRIDAADLVELFAQWGRHDHPSRADLDGDNDVDADDLVRLLEQRRGRRHPPRSRRGQLDRRQPVRRPQ